MTFHNCYLHGPHPNPSPQFRSVQLKMVSMRSEKPITTLTTITPRLSEVSQRCLWNVPAFVWFSDDGPLSSFQGGSSSVSSFHASLLQAIDGVMSLGLCPLVVSQAFQHTEYLCAPAKERKASRRWHAVKTLEPTSASLPSFYVVAVECVCAWKKHGGGRCCYVTKSVTSWIRQ